MLLPPSPAKPGQAAWLPCGALPWDSTHNRPATVWHVHELAERMGLLKVESRHTRNQRTEVSQCGAAHATGEHTPAGRPDGLGQSVLQCHLHSCLHLLCLLQPNVHVNVNVQNHNHNNNQVNPNINVGWAR